VIVIKHSAKLFKLFSNREFFWVLLACTNCYKQIYKPRNTLSSYIHK